MTSGLILLPRSDLFRLGVSVAERSRLPDENRLAEETRETTCASQRPD